MKPLSVLNYNKNNKKRLISSIISVMIAVAFLYVMNIYVESVKLSLHKSTVAQFQNYARIKVYGNEKSVPQNIISRLKNNKNVERLIPFRWYGLEFDIAGSTSLSEALAINESDMKYFLQKQNTRLLLGRLPQKDKNEIAIDYFVAKNRKISIGDNVGAMVSDYDGMSGKYKIVGILKGENMVSISPMNSEASINGDEKSDLMKTGIIIFPYKNKIDQVNSLVESFPKGYALYETINIMDKQFEKDTGFLEILDIISILTIVLMVITVGSSKYIEFLSRREELGILNAIGYSKKQILKRAVVEVICVNSMAYVLGLIMGIIISYICKKYFFEGSGAVGTVFNVKAFIVAAYIPLFTSLFTIIPINLIINKLDPINMIENN